jgi:CRISPR-associated protein Cmr6
MSLMPGACRKALDGIRLEDGQNAALLLARYLKRKDEEMRRDELLNAAASAVGYGMKEDTGFYKHAFDRRSAMLGGEVGIFKLAGRMVIGLGASNVLKAGLTLNPVYGTPLIPGSALKGLAAHYCSEVWGGTDPKFKSPGRNSRGNITRPAGEHHRFIFGGMEDAGFIIFHDAWIIPHSLNNSLVRDAITPHHGGYYIPVGDRSAPTDFDSPIPVPFLSVKGEFEIRVNCDGGAKGKDWEKLTMKLLKEALENWGIGGKTNSGYGIGTLD